MPWNLGSFATELLLLIPNVSDNVSGALLRIIDRERLFVEEYTGATLGSTAIPEKYQAAVLARSMYKVYSMIQADGSDSSNVRLGDFSVSKGTSSNLSEALNSAKEAADEEMRNLGFSTRFYKANG
jgi:hypothetical protein